MPTVGLVQAPQDHRDGERSLMHHAMNGEYAGFFDIGMVQRNEVNAIIVHGTMCLIRRAALEAAGGWSSDTICEDTDLGLTLLELGWRAHYTNQRYGHGLLPDSFEAYKKQRHRWAYGGFQILKKHWRRFLPGASRLTRDQKREFALGWLNWLGAESIGVVVAILNIIWVPVVAFLDIAVPDRILTVPIIASFVVSVAHFVTLYRLRVRTTKASCTGAVFAAMSVQWTVARAVGFGLIKDHLPFVRTAKGGLRRSTRFPRVLGSGAGRAVDPRRGRAGTPPTSSKCARSISSPSCCWCRACRSSPPSRWRCSSARSSTTSPTGARSRRGSANCCHAAVLGRVAKPGAGAVPAGQADRTRAVSIASSPAARFPPASPNTTCRAGSRRR